MKLIFYKMKGNRMSKIFDKIAGKSRLADKIDFERGVLRAPSP